MVAPNLEYSKLQAVHKDKVINELVSSFTFEEPTNVAVDLTMDESRACFVDFVLAALEDNCSFVCTDNSTDRLVGYRLNTIYGAKHAETNQQQYPANHLLVLDFLDKLAHKTDQLIRNAIDRKIMKFDVVHVDKEYRRMGIAQKLVELSLAFAKENQFDWIVTTPTSFKSQQLFEKLGFSTLYCWPYKDYAIDGKMVFTKLPDGEECAKLMALEISQCRDL